MCTTDLAPTARGGRFAIDSPMVQPPVNMPVLPGELQKDSNVTPIDEDFAGQTDLDVAALPATVAPKWAARVPEAMNDPQTEASRGDVVSPSDPIVESEKRKRIALQIVSMCRR
jgi:hypothetical protein